MAQNFSLLLRQCARIYKHINDELIHLEDVFSKTVNAFVSINYRIKPHLLTVMKRPKDCRHSSCVTSKFCSQRNISFISCGLIATARAYTVVDCTCKSQRVIILYEPFAVGKQLAKAVHKFFICCNV